MRRWVWAAAPAIVLSSSTSYALSVRTDRPRLFLSNGTGFGTTVAGLKTRCADTTNYAGCMASLGTAAGGPESYAAAYVITGDATACSTAMSTIRSSVVLPTGISPSGGDAHTYTSNNGGQMFTLAVTRDWCDAALASADATWLESTIATIADWYVSYVGNGLDVYHDDMPNVWSAIALAGLVLKGTSEDTKASAYLSAADTQWKTIIFPAMAYEGDYWHEGMTYVQVSLGLMAWYALGWSTATDDNVYDWAKANANDLFDGYIDFLAYTLRPDETYAYFGDTSDNKQSIQLFSRYLVDLFTIGTGSTLGQGLSLEIAKDTPGYYDYAGAARWKMALLFDATKNPAAVARSMLPTGRWMSQGGQDVASLRSGWGPDDVFVYMTCGDYFGPHQHIESGSFHIGRDGILTGPTGYYDDYGSTHWYDYYSQHSVHSNTLAVLDPGESFPNESTDACGSSPEVNEGGQRPVQRDKMCDSFPNPDLTTYLMHKSGPPYNETGDMTAFQTTSCFDYVGCNVTAAYSSPGYLMDGNTAKVNEVSRQLVFLHPELAVVFDRVESTDASFEKRFLLHDSIPGQSPQVNGSSFTITNPMGAKLFGQTLLPAGATLNTVTNFKVAGMSYPPSMAGNESGGARLEVVAPPGNARDYFLHVFDAALPGTKSPTSTVSQDSDSATVSIDDGKNTYVVVFVKSGALGGHVTITSNDGGAATCDLALGGESSTDGGNGSMGPTGDAGPGAVPMDAAAQGPDGGARSPEGGSASQPARSRGGCGCEVVSRAPPVLPLAIVPVLALVRRRGRRSRTFKGKTALLPPEDRTTA
jgi:hypothetical protein